MSCDEASENPVLERVLWPQKRGSPALELQGKGRVSGAAIPKNEILSDDSILAIVDSWRETPIVCTTCGGLPT